MKKNSLKIFWLFLLFSFCLNYPIWSENNFDSQETDSLEIITIIDSTQVDSLESIAVIDSSIVEIDSTFIEEIIEEEPIDSFYIDIQKLKEQVDSLVSIRKEIEKYESFPCFIYNENFHLKSLYEPDIWLRKNGFLIIPFLTSRTHLMQNYAPFFQTEFSQNQVSYYQANYDLPVAMTEAILGLGDLDMNHALVRFQKGNVFNIRNLNAKFDYFGQDGYWYSVFETSSNFNMHLFYDHRFGRFHYYHTTIDQEIPSDKLSENPALTSKIKEKSSDNDFLWENKILNAGIQSENYEVDNLEKKQTHLLLNKNLDFPHHKIQSAFEYFIQSEPDDRNYSIFNLKGNSKIFTINFDNSVIYQNNDNFLISSKIDRKIYRSFGLVGKYSKVKSDIFSEKKGIGLGFFPNHQKAQIIVGEIRNSILNSIFLETNNNLIFKHNRFEFEFLNWAQYLTESKTYPIWQTKTFLNLIYKLEYSNAIKLGFSYLYNSEFQNVADTLVKDSSNLDVYFAIKITEKFEIKIDAINILNSDEMFGNNIPERHYNFGVNWIFVN